MLQYPRWKTILVIAVSLLGILYALPNLLGRDTRAALQQLPSWLPGRTVSLGLDLQGGSHLLLEVQTDVLIQERLVALQDSVRGALRQANIGYTDLRVEGGNVRFALRDPAQVEQVLQTVRNLDSELRANAEGGRIAVSLTEAAAAQRRSQAVDQSIEIVRRRVDETGTREPTIQRQGENRILLQLPGLDDPERVKRLLGQTAKLTFRLVDLNVSAADAAAGRVPPGSELLQQADRSGPIAVQRRIMVDGSTLVDAQPTFQDGQPVVSFRFDTQGARRFADATRDNVGRPFAIVLDNRVISAPVIREPILGGSGIISGSFTVQSANELALLLRAGALPAPLTVLEERTVGPGLGADSIVAGEIASIAGLGLVVVMMVAIYGLFGVFAVVALFINMAFIFAAMSLLQATLTLPGIAGIVLSIGMAVDANVLIYERIREETRAGRSVMSALDAGFSRAMSAIFDSNLTGLIACLLLYAFGTGPVRGFAVTLGIGILASMFTAIMVTRLFIVFWLRRTRPKAIPI
ncbi:MAG TPA: protein translocase subunit SecD [Azospirillaceae bacterium]|nr:protein translocase subunit SecD [Azospirillaceae bacterium]